jgi:hypothetical protein
MYTIIKYSFHDAEENIWEEMAGDWRRLHNEELHNLYASPDIVRVTKLRRKGQMKHVAHMGKMGNVQKIFVGKPEGKRPLGRSRRRWYGILEWILGK